MRALIDGKSGEFVRCLMENGDLLTVHVSVLPQGCEAGDVLRLQFVKDDVASQKQRELIQRLQQEA